MDSKQCIRRAEAIVAAKGRLSEARAAQHAVAVSLQKTGLLVVCDETPTYYCDGLHMPLRHEKDGWRVQFSLNKKAIEALRPAVMDAYDEQVREAQEALDNLLEEDSHVSD
jgi:hypothetical protein